MTISQGEAVKPSGAPAVSSSSSPSSSSAPASKKPTKAKAAALDPAAIEEKRRARAEKKEKEAREKAAAEAEAFASGLSAPIVDASGRPLYRPRQWGKVKGIKPHPVDGSGKKRLKILSWNMLAQGLVRRKVFPGSDALRWKDREAGLAAELTGHGWDVACLQEVDRHLTHAETLRLAGYSHFFVKGYAQKQHGLMLAWRSRERASGFAAGSDVIFEEEPVASRILFYDDEEISPGRTGCSRITRNIALFVAIKFKQRELNSNSPKGIILATTHLFWHPMHSYERVRQAGLLTKALDKFRRSEGAEWEGWPTILTGDFNDQPHSASYGLLTGRRLEEEIMQDVSQSRVVHQSVDDREQRRAEGKLEAVQINEEDINCTNGEDAQDEGEDAVDDDEQEGEREDEEGADDQMLKNCRPAKPSDGLLTWEELQQLYSLPSSSNLPQHFRSAYASSYPLLEDPSESSNLFSSVGRGRERWDDTTWQDGVTPNPHLHLAGSSAGSEPMWTLYSSLFALTLDFIFLMPSLSPAGSDRVGEGKEENVEQYPLVTRLLRTHRTDVVKDGLPRKGVCVSDHIAIGAELEL